MQKNAFFLEFFVNLCFYGIQGFDEYEKLNNLDIGINIQIINDMKFNFHWAINVVITFIAISALIYAFYKSNFL